MREIKNNNRTTITFLLIIYLLSFHSSRAQEEWKMFPKTHNSDQESFASDSKKPEKDPKLETSIKELDKIIEQLTPKADEQLTMEGFRIQIYFGSGSGSKQEAVKLQNELTLLFPNLKSYLLYQSPNFKLRVGDFRNRLQAEHELQALKAVYPNAFITKDQINLPDLD